MREPKNLDEMQIAMQTFDRLLEEAPIMSEDFPTITDQIITLDKYKVEFKEEIRALEKNIPIEWLKYLELLEEAEKLLNYAKVVDRDAKKANRNLIT